MAHYVVCNGCVYSNSILGFDPQGNYEVVPFTHEIASTEFVSGVALYVMQILIWRWLKALFAIVVLWLNLLNGLWQNVAKQVDKR